MYNLRTLIKYEYKKLLQRKSVWIVTLTLMLLTSVSVALPPLPCALYSFSLPLPRSLPFSYTGRKASRHRYRFLCPDAPGILQWARLCSS